MFVFFFFQAEDGIRDFCLSRGLGDVYKRQALTLWLKNTSAEERELLLRGCLMNHYAAQKKE